MTELASPAQLRGGFIRWALFLVPGILLLGLLSVRLGGIASGNPWFDSLIYPSPQAFGIVWAISYVLMGFALAMIASARGARGRGIAIAIFVVQLLLNLAWSPLFFAVRQMTAALVLIGLLDIAVLATMALFWRVRPLATWLLAPYLAWILFATYLNYEVVIANPGAVTRIEL